MYNVNMVEYRNIEPWNKSILERLEVLHNDIEKGYKISVQLYDKADSSTFRYLCYNICQYSRDSENWKSHYFFKDECNVVKDHLKDIDLLIFCRTLWTYPYQELLDMAKQNGIPVVFQIDDLICVHDYIVSFTNQIGEFRDTEEFYSAWFGLTGRYYQFAKQANGFIVTNDYLGERLKEEFNKPFKVIHNSLNEGQIFVSNDYWNQKKRQKSRKPFTIGYFSGSPTHENDFRIVTAELEELLKTYRDISLLLVGYMNFPQTLLHHLDKRLISVPFVDFIELQYHISRVDVCIAPLKDSVFANCKSELKFFESAIVGTPVAATPTYTFKDAIINGENGFLCKEGEWFDTLEGLYLGKYDTKSIVNNAYETAKNRYSGKSIIDEIEDAFDFFCI